MKHKQSSFRRIFVFIACILCLKVGCCESWVCAQRKIDWEWVYANEKTDKDRIDLLNAIHARDLAKIRELVESGVSVTAQRMEGLTVPLYNAIDTDDLAIFLYLTEHGANLCHPDEFFGDDVYGYWQPTPLEAAVVAGAFNIARYLFRNSDKTEIDTLHLLQSAINGNSYKIVEFMIKEKYTNIEEFKEAVLAGHPDPHAYENTLPEHIKTGLRHMRQLVRKGLADIDDYDDLVRILEEDVRSWTSKDDRENFIRFIRLAAEWEEVRQITPEEFRELEVFYYKHN